MPNTVVTSDYFQRQPLFIPNGVSVNVAAPGDPVDNQSSTDRLIEVYEPEILIKAIGITYYDQLVMALDDLSTPERIKWKRLVEGHSYTLDEVSYRWEGLRGRAQNSLVAHYIFCQYLVLQEETLTTMGAIKPKAKAAAMVTATNKYIRSWHTFLRMYQNIDSGLPVVSFNDFGTIGIDYSKGRNKTRSLLQFFNDMEVLEPTYWPDLQFGIITLEESNNSFGF